MSLATPRACRSTPASRTHLDPRHLLRRRPGTTGIYIDDSQSRFARSASTPDDTLVKTFDLDRVEVLRGPQGTLFGAGSEGGTVRYIMTQPSVNEIQVYAAPNVSYTEGGATKL